MKICVIGANGFVGRNLTHYLGQYHEVFPITRDNLNLLDANSVESFLTSANIDIVINCAASMTNAIMLNDTYNNLGIFINFYNFRHKFTKLINLASGAEFDRTTNINLAKEFEIFLCLPKDSYGFGQNIKARLAAQTENFYNIRIFNCFGYGELETRLYPRILNSSSLDITNDRYFDYFSIQDLQKLVQHCISNDWQIKDVNAVYEHKVKISEAAEAFKRINNLSTKINVISNSNQNYTGCYKSINSLGIHLDGLDQGFKDYQS